MIKNLEDQEAKKNPQENPVSKEEEEKKELKKEKRWK